MCLLWFCGEYILLKLQFNIWRSCFIHIHLLPPLPILSLPPILYRHTHFTQVFSPSSYFAVIYFIEVSSCSAMVVCTCTLRTLLSFHFSPFACQKCVVLVQFLSKKVSGRWVKLTETFVMRLHEESKFKQEVSGQASPGKQKSVCRKHHNYRVARMQNVQLGNTTTTVHDIWKAGNGFCQFFYWSSVELFEELVP